MLDFRMNTFLTVCRCMNFTRASEELHITQPAVSQHIRYLEKHYGQKLFCYEGKRLGLTAAGEMLRNTSLTMLHDELALQNRMQQEGEAPGELRFGVVSSLGDSRVTDAVKEYLKKDYGKDRQGCRRLKMETGQSAKLLQKLDRDEIDFVLADDTFSQKKYEFYLYEKVRMLAVCSPDYRFFKKPKELKDLTKECLLIGARGDGARNTLESLMNDRNLCMEDFAKAAEIGNLHTMKELTKAGCGITFLYETAVWKELNCGELKEIKLRDFHVSDDFHFVWKKGNPSAGRYRELFGQYRK